MKQLFAAVILLCFTAFLAGCHSDEKQAVQIHDKLEKAVADEEAFVSSQKELDAYRKKEQEVYNDLSNLDIRDQDEIKQRLHDAGKYTQKQKQFVQEAEENFQNAYDKSVSIKKNVKKIKDKDEKKQAEILLKVVKERKKLIDHFFDEFQDQLKLLASFYDHFDEDKSSVDELDDQIGKINKYSEDMEVAINRFNRYTGQYNRIKEDYYRMAGLL